MTREEAIRRIKAWNLDSDDMEVLAVVIPELAESEDERIRRKMLEHFRSKTKETWCNIPVKDIIAYLEKQKEVGIQWLKSDNVKNPDKPYIDKAGMFYTTDGRMCYASEIEKQKEQKPSGETNVEPSSKIPREEYLYHLLANDIITFSDYTYLIAKKPFDYECANIPQKDYTPVEQKPAEWSEEDKKTIDDAYCWLCEYAGSLIQRNYGKSSMLYGIANKLKSLHSQPKQEWSEEDEANRTFILESLEDQIRFCKKDAKGAYYTKQIRTAQNWLKSLSLNLKKKNEDVAKLCSNE